MSEAALSLENVSVDEENAAWASVNTPLPPEELIAFCQEDVERLFRINPYLEFKAWRTIGERRHTFAAVNSSRENPFEFSFELEVDLQPDGVSIHYLEGLKRSTRFRVEPSEHGSKLTIIEDYRTPPAGATDETLLEVDRSLVTWAGDIQKFLVQWHQWQWLQPWRWYMNRVWKRMKPSGRRIAYIFWWITLVEIALIALGAGIYWLEYS